MVATGAGGRMRNVCIGEAPDALVAIACRPAKRTGLAGRRALAVVVITPGKLVAPAGILSLIMLPADDVGIGIEVGVPVEDARGLNKVG